ncbi:DUF4269 domain-containing protein [Pedobacter sp. HDW13]|uniref:DUF4269 domain-containing protein n=1 Tax=unclassified Pedobacter TaxID=2628915 RepID=UPI000F5AE417|nr:MULTISPECIES: DUF4269 domain-containing protein [unclassified Pedobacter]QIL38908.1 DUF4269 domain-containing protein [Pedobacter sp. HDW13]RQO72552.1 DUF4269 domain-containing protein [Pedobacter sp. KBW01]
MINFLNISYLQSGNEKQQQAYQVLTAHQILEKLTAFSPILTGTIPINIDIESSDLDIICYVQDKATFTKILTDLFQNEKGFMITENPSFQSIKANFFIEGFEFEIFGQSIPTTQQNAYRHMLIEHQILLEKGETFRQEIISLKKQGIKTEPAFAQLLGMTGNAYQELLKLALSGEGFNIKT